MQNENPEQMNMSTLKEPSECESTGKNTPSMDSAERVAGHEDEASVNGTGPSASADRQQFQPEDGDISGTAYHALLKAYHEVVDRNAKLEEDCQNKSVTIEQYLRNIARSQTLIPRLEKRIEETRKYGAEKLGRDILKTHDNLERALAAARDNDTGDIKALVSGIEVLFRELKKSLSRHSITRIEPREGDDFDPNLHEALYNLPVEEFEEGQIFSVEEIGFLLHDRLLRPAKVGVAAAIEAPPEE